MKKKIATEKQTTTDSPELVEETVVPDSTEVTEKTSETESVSELVSKKADSLEWEETAKKVVNAVKVEWENTIKSQLKIAVLLHWIHKNQAFTLDNCTNIYEFAKKHFEMSRGSCHNYLKVAEKFAITSESGIPEEMQIEEKYQDFRFSQLVVMAQVDDVDSYDFDPHMSTRNMKEKIKRVTSSKEAQKTEKEAKKLLYRLKSMEEYDAKSSDIDALIKKALKDSHGNIEITYVSN